MSLTTEQLRSKLLDYCMGLLPASEEAQVERAILEDGRLAEEAQRVRDLLQVARRSDALEWTEARSAANFAAIAAALGSETVPHTAQTEAPATLEAAQRPTSRSPKQRRVVGWLVAAAALFLGLSAGFAALHQEKPGSVESPPAVAAKPERAPAPSLRPRSPAVAKGAPDVWAALPRTGARPEGFPGSIFASRTSDWRAQAERDWTVYLASGALLVEWMPAGAEHLFVRTPNETIEVTGTVFAVEVTRDATEVSVVEGSVVVSRTDGAHAGERAEVRRGGRWRSDDGQGEISGAVSTAAGLRIDLVAHRVWMSTHRGASLQAEARKRVQRPKGVVVPPSDAAPAEPTLSVLADEALARGEHSLAAALLEQWVAKAPAPSTRRAAKLDLARIYLYELHQPERGAAHLRELLDGAPADRLAVTLRSELCSLRLPQDARLCGAN